MSSDPASSNPATDNLEISQLERGKAEYQAGQIAFERGQYRQSVQHLEKASALIAPSSALGGEVQIWLVTAYEAAGQPEAAIGLCQKLSRHPNLDTRKQSRRLLPILQAPRLVSRPEWLTQIPDLAAVADQKNVTPSKLASATTRKPRPAKPPSLELKQMNLQDNPFIWVALAILGIMLVGWTQLS